MQTGEFDALLGRLVNQQADLAVSKSGGTVLRQPGAIDRFASVAPPITMINTVAEKLEASGQMFQAVGVYLLAGEAKSLLAAVRLMNLLLVGVVAIEDGANASLNGSGMKSNRDSILKLATEVSLHLTFTIMG